jgi:hypothetical protein
MADPMRPEIAERMTYHLIVRLCYYWSETKYGACELGFMAEMNRPKPAEPGAWETYLELSRKARVGLNVELDDALPEHLSSYSVNPASLDSLQEAS